MRRLLTFILLQLFLLGAVSSATFEVDDDLMRNIEDTAKSLDSNIAQREAKAATAEARELADVFVQIEAFYAGKPDGAQGVTHSRKSQELALKMLQGIQAQDFDGAANTLNDLTRNCKACHQVYKKE